MNTPIQHAAAAPLMSAITRALAAFALLVTLATASHATITGDALPPNPFGWTPNSTNALNYADQAPGRIGQGAPYVILNSTAVGSVFLDFLNFGNNGLAFFETRIDGIATGATAHPVVSGDTIHTGGTAVAANTSVLGKQFNATNYVDIRLALGGERDYDFDWVRFEVESAPVPDASSTLVLLSLGLIGIGVVRRKR